MRSLLKQFNVGAVLVSFSLLWNCGGEAPKEQQSAQTKPEMIAANEEDLIKAAGLSFYKWYLNGLNQDSVSIPFEGEVIKDKNGKCRLDLSPYFLELKKLNTVSEKFMEKEQQRLKDCAEYITTVPFTDYQNADAYTYDKHCGSFYYYYWIRSQELFESCDAKQVIRSSDRAAYLDVYFTYKGESQDKTPLSRVYLEKENELWKIVDIKFTDTLTE